MIDAGLNGNADAAYKLYQIYEVGKYGATQDSDRALTWKKEASLLGLYCVALFDFQTVFYLFRFQTHKGNLRRPQPHNKKKNKKIKIKS